MRSFARFMAWAVLIVGGLWFWMAYVADAVLDVGLRRAEEGALVLGVAALGGAAAWYGYFRGDRTPKWFVALGVLWALAAYGVSLGHDGRDGGYIADYCAYGSASQAQLDGCIDHVDDTDIDRLGHQRGSLRPARHR